VTEYGVIQMRGEYMSKSKRLIELMMAVNRKRKFTVRELAEEFGVSTRTMLRDLQELSGMGVPLFSEVGASGGYQVLTERVLPPIAFTEEEGIAMFFACHALRHHTSLPFETPSSSALRKFFAHLPDDVKVRIEEMRNRVDFYTPTRKQKSEFLEILLDAAIKQQPVTIEYGTEPGGERDIQPIGIYADEGFWYCPAYCYERQAFRLFRVDRIRSAVMVEMEQRLAPDHLHEVNLLNWGSRFHQSLKRVHFRVKLSKRGVDKFHEKRWLFPLPEVMLQPDGSGVLEGMVPEQELAFFANYFFSFGKDAVVRAPEELVHAVKGMFSEALSAYENQMGGDFET
jgi:predicted DNA-binding transcriptional regulator YafY